MQGTAAAHLTAIVALLAFATPPVVAQQATAPAVDSTDPDQKIKCRKYLAPGSLVRKVKTCRTVSEWRKSAQAGNDAARHIVGENVCSGGECRGYEPPDAPQ